MGIFSRASKGRNDGHQLYQCLFFIIIVVVCLLQHSSKSSPIVFVGFPALDRDLLIHGESIIIIRGSYGRPIRATSFARKEATAGE